MTTINFFNSNNATAIDYTAQMFDGIMANAQKIGNKYFATIYTSLLTTDPTYQRSEVIDPRKVQRLADSWEDGLCDPVQVSPHPEEHKFYAYDGLHRILVQSGMGRTMIVCEINMGLANMEPEARRLEEARLFAKQYDCVDRLSVMQRHKVNVLLGVHENVYVHNLCVKYGISDDKTGLSSRSKAVKTLTGLNKALLIAKKKENYLDDTFNVVCNCGWKTSNDGFKGYVLYAFEHIFASHPDRRSEVAKALIEWLRPEGKTKKGISEKLVEAEAVSKYITYGDKSIAMTLYMEDYLHREIGLPYTYTGKNETVIVRKGA